MSKARRCKASRCRQESGTGPGNGGLGVSCLFDMGQEEFKNKRRRGGCGGDQGKGQRRGEEKGMNKAEDKRRRKKVRSNKVRSKKKDFPSPPPALDLASTRLRHPSPTSLPNTNTTRQHILP